MRKKLIELLRSDMNVLKAAGTSATATLRLADNLIENGVRLEESKRIEKLEAKLAEREETVSDLRKKWYAAETHICTMCGHFNHKTDGNIVYGNKDCGEIVGYPCCGKFTPWIPVTERLPEGMDWVLCACKDGEIRILCYDYIMDDWDIHGRPNSCYAKGFVTHWMPLPEPPMGEV